MRSARNQFILLGLICQGLTLNDFTAPLAYTLAWVLCLALPRHPIRLGYLAEAGLIAAGGAAGFVIAKAFGYSAHFAIGHSLAWLQLGRLLRPLNLHEKLVSLLVAALQIAAVCTFLMDYRFIAVLIFTVVLLPRALIELRAATFLMETDAFPAPQTYARHRLARWIYPALFAGAIGCFLIVPRGLMGGALQLPVVRPTSDDTLLDAVLDPARSSSSNARRILFQVQADHLGYLRCYALTVFDGKLWSREQGLIWRRFIMQDIREQPSPLSRVVRIKNPAWLGRVLPVDGTVMALDGTFFHDAYQTTHGIVETEMMWRRANNTYRYWLDPQSRQPPLLPREIEKLKWHPAQSEQLRLWVSNVTAGISEPLEKARRLENALRQQCAYQIGAPELNRVNPIDDFMFREKAGHCERFAAALALFFRMEGIPSRIIIGYVPHRRNRLTGWYDIRLRDAHAWTEGWFPGKGWVQFDATPAATIAPPSVWSDWLDELDFAWYSHVVNFDSGSQTAIVKEVGNAARKAAHWFHNHWPWFAVLAIGGSLVLAWSRRNRASISARNRLSVQQTTLLAEHYYGRMLRLLARHGFHRTPEQTPFEFLAKVRSANAVFTKEVELITHWFCATRYGHHGMTSAEHASLEAAIDKIRKYHPNAGEITRAATSETKNAGATV